MLTPGDDYAVLSNHLRPLPALSCIGKRLCTDNIKPDHLSALVTCRLIPLEKCPRVQPIVIGEVHRRIIAKVILSLSKQDILDAAGPLQVCAGQDSGCEAAIHAMRQAFANVETEGAQLVDATNAFNSINQLHYITSVSYAHPSPKFYPTPIKPWSVV